MLFRRTGSDSTISFETGLFQGISAWKTLTGWENGKPLPDKWQIGVKYRTGIWVCPETSCATREQAEQAALALADDLLEQEITILQRLRESLKK